MHPASSTSRARRRWTALAALGVATAIWLPSMHLFFAADGAAERPQAALSARAEALAAQHLHLWTDPVERERAVARMRTRNAEWDFMGRSFLVWALADMALRDPQERAHYLEVVDAIVEETLRLEHEESMYFFLMNYARRGRWRQTPARSIFVDGEIALMLGLRQLVEPRDEYEAPLARRVERLLERMEASPVLSCESYPDECWMFCNAVACAALAVADALDGQPTHADFLERWVAAAREHLTDPETGLLVSSFRYDGTHLDGPEGSSVWMAIHCLRIVDEEFAADQYERARAALGTSFLGFGYSREWPASWRGPMDVDSGAVVPLLDASVGGSGMAFLGAATMDDHAYFGALLTALDFAGFPIQEGDRLRYGAGNQVGDAVLLYACVLGPTWDEVRRRRMP